MDRVEPELELLKTAHPDLDYIESDGKHWVRVPRHPVPDQWAVAEIEVALQIPPSAGQAPYGFWVRPGLTLATGETPDNYTFPASTPWGDDWGQFSWSPVQWVPKDDIRAGANMLDFLRSIADRLNEGK